MNIKKPSFLKGTLAVGINTLASRILGFVRDLLVAKLFGASMIADAFFVAYRVPNLLRSLVAEGALTSAFIPVFASELKKSKADAQSSLSGIFTLLISFTTLVTILGIFFSPQIANFFAPGFDRERSLLCIELMRIMFPYIICVSLVAILGGVLNTLHIFGSAAFAQVLMNFVLILGALSAQIFHSSAAQWLAYSVIIGGMVQVAYQIPSLKRAGLYLKFTKEIWTPAVRQTLILMLPAIIGATVYQLSIFFNTFFASFLRAGSVSWLFYADRLVQLPIGIISLAIASVLLPALATAHSSENKYDFNHKLITSLNYSSFLILPCSFGLFFLAESFIRLLFERGAFTSFSTSQTALAVQAYSLGLWALSCQSILSRAFIAQKDTKTSSLIGFLSLCLSLVLCLCFMGKVAQESATAYLIADIQNYLPSFDLGHAGLALASSICAFFSFICLALRLKKRMPELSYGKFVRSSLQSLFSSILMIIGFYYFDFNNLSHRGGAYLYLSPFLGTITGAFIYIFSQKILKNVELEETFSKVLRIHK